MLLRERLRTRTRENLKIRLVVLNAFLTFTFIKNYKNTVDVRIIKTFEMSNMPAYTFLSGDYLTINAMQIKSLEQFKFFKKNKTSISNLLRKHLLHRFVC